MTILDAIAEARAMVPPPEYYSPGRWAVTATFPEVDTPGTSYPMTAGRTAALREEWIAIQACELLGWAQKYREKVLQHYRMGDSLLDAMAKGAPSLWGKR